MACVNTVKEDVNYSLITGSFSNCEGKNMWLVSSPFVPLGDQYLHEKKGLQPNERGAFADTIYLEGAKDFIFCIDKSSVTIHLKPGEHLNLTADCNELVSTIKYSGKTAPINNYLLQYNQLFQDHNKQYSTILKLNEAEFVKAKAAYKNSIYQLLDSQEELTEEFVASQKRDIHYRIIASYLNYEERHGKAVGNESFKTSDNFLDIVKTVNMEDPKELEKSVKYGFLLKKYYSFEYEKLGDFYEDDKVKFIQFLSSKITDKNVKDRLLYFYGKPAVVSTKEVQLCYDILMENISNERYKKEITEKYNQLKTTLPGQKSPLFTNYQNANGGTNSLSDFLGKYVYIDVWATWCGPCKAEIPYLKEVEKKYHDKNIVFISLSVDNIKSIDRWKKFVNDKELGGVQVIADKERESDFIKKYQIEGIPRFILIDPNGKIISADAPRPSDKKLIELFNEHRI